MFDFGFWRENVGNRVADQNGLSRRFPTPGDKCHSQLRYNQNLQICGGGGGYYRVRLGTPLLHLFISASSSVRDCVAQRLRHAEFVSVVFRSGALLLPR